MPFFFFTSIFIVLISGAAVFREKSFNYAFLLSNLIFTAFQIQNLCDKHLPKNILKGTIKHQVCPIEMITI